MAGDLSWASVALLLHGDGADGSTVFTDSSSFARNGSIALGAPVISTAKSKFGGASVRFPGGAILNFGTAANWAALHNSGAKWTIEGWFSFDDFTDVRTLFATNESASANAGVYCNLTAARKVNLQITRAASGSFVVNSDFSGTFPNDTNLHHIAVLWDESLSSGNAVCYIDGVAAGTLNKTGNAPSAANPPTPLRLGGIGTTGNMLGYMDEVRVTQGVWRYNAAFTPDAAAFHDGMGQVQGVVRDATGAFAARRVIALRRDTRTIVAETMSDAGTGAYSMYTPTLDEVTRIVLDNAVAGTIYNDLVDRVIPA